jgi:hypothetical protein
LALFRVSLVDQIDLPTQSHIKAAHSILSGERINQMELKMKQFVIASVTAALFAGLSTTVDASVVNYTTSSPSCSVFDVDPNSDACFGSTSGNAQQVDPNGDMFDGVTGLFGITDWVEIQSVGSVSGDQKTGTITVMPNSSGIVAVLLKSGPQFAAYKFESGFSGDLKFTTANEKGLSNWIAFGSGEMTPVPLPAAGWMLLAGIGGLAALRRRKNA